MGTFVTAAGFQRRTLTEITADLEQAFRATFGEQLDTDPAGKPGQLIGLIAKALSDAWEISQEVYASHDPNQAVGLALDVVCNLTGVDRIEGAASQCLVACYAANDNLGLVLDPGKQVRRTRGALVFSLRAPLTVQESACRDLYLVLSDEPVAGSTVTLTTSFGTFTAVTPVTNNPAIAVYQLLAEQIEASSWGGSAQWWNVGGAPAGAQYTAPCLRLVLPDADFGVVLGASWEAALCGSVGWFDADVDGPNTAYTGEINQINTPTTGWALCYNLQEAILGRYVETDEELRLRRAQSFRVGYATDAAIQQALLNRVPGIVSALVVSNRTLVVDGDGRRPKSFEAIVQGGLAADIGQVIWDTMPAGIESYADTSPGGGGTAVTVIDSEGTEQVVKFSRPVTKYVHVKITYSLYSEEVFPVDGEARMRAAILAWAPTEFTLGKDVIPQRFFAPVYTVPGIGAATVQVATTNGEDDTPTWTSSPVPLNGRGVGVVLEKNIALQVAV